MESGRFRSPVIAILMFVFVASLVPEVAGQELNEMCPVWSTQGDLVATPFRDSRGNYDVYVISLSESSFTRLTIDPAKDSSPSWSPDGNQLVFQSNQKPMSNHY